MLKYFLYILILLIVVILGAFAFHKYKVEDQNKKEMAQYMGEPVMLEKDLGRVLVIYYSLNGHTRDIAEKIQSLTNGDIYAIQTEEKFETNFGFYLDVLKQLYNKQYPELSTMAPDVSSYDIVFVGFPVWWYTMATPAYSFLKQADFGTTKVALFSTQGSNPGRFFFDFANNVQGSKLVSMKEFNNLPQEYDEAVRNKVAAWLNSL